MGIDVDRSGLIVTSAKDKVRKHLGECSVVDKSPFHSESPSRVLSEMAWFRHLRGHPVPLLMNRNQEHPHYKPETNADYGPTR